MTTNYDQFTQFLADKAQLGGYHGFKPTFLPDWLFDYQNFLIDWSVQKGKCALFTDCGTGKTPLELVWGQNVVEKTNGRVLILAPLAVGHQHLIEAEKFKIELHRSHHGELAATSGMFITNYQRIHHFNASDFVACIADESSIIKSIDGVIRGQVTEFMRRMKYRLLGTATAAPNDYVELGTSSEAIGELGHMDMLNRFFKNARNNTSTGRSHSKSAEWRFKGHAEIPFWRWVASWARAMRKPSDLGFSDEKFKLPKLIENVHRIDTVIPANGWLFNMPACGLHEQRQERRRTIDLRCERAAELAIAHKGASVSWCSLNDEGDLLEKLIPGSVQVSGKDSDDAKEEKLMAFAKGQFTKLVTKQIVCGWGLNWQFCNHMTDFPSHSYEQYYQSVRRLWRYGQKKKVTVDIVTTEGEQDVLKNRQRKAQQADQMFSHLVREMTSASVISKDTNFNEQEDIPAWL